MSKQLVRAFLVFAVIVTLVAYRPPQAGHAQAPDEPVAMPGRLVPLLGVPVDSGTSVDAPSFPSAAGTNSTTFVVNYTGFNGANGAAAQAAFQAAVDIWANSITSPVSIVVNAQWSDLGGPSGGSIILGQAGPSNFWNNFSGQPVANTYYPQALANKLHGSRIAGGPAEDIDAQFNSNAAVNWYYGTDGNTPAGLIDFESVVLHELGHGLGFLSAFSYNAGVGTWSLANSRPAIFGRGAVNSSTGNSVNLVTGFADNSVALGSQFVNGGQYWNGTATTAANGGNNARLYAPNPWQSGSSMSHLDEATYPAGNANSLMTPSIGSHESIHSPGPITLAMFADMGWTVGGGGGNPVPAITSLSPNSATAGAAAFTLTVNGSNFVSGAVVNWNGSTRTTTFVNSGQLTASINAADVTTAGTPSVTVFNPAPGGGTSSGSTFTVNNPVPAIGSLSPNNGTAGGAAFALTVNGSNFVNGSTVNWNGSARTTVFVNSGQLTASILAADIASIGTPSVTVVNAAPGGGTSAGSTFTINPASNPVPSITSLSPNTKLAGSGAFTLTVNGSGFVGTSVVNWNGSARTTTFVNSGQLTASILAADIAAAGAPSVTVFSPAPGGGTSAGSTFTITNNPVPGLSSLSPSTTMGGGPAFTLTVNGSSFVAGSVVNWNGSARTTTFVNSGQLTAAIQASDIAVAGTPAVTVFNPAPGGGTSAGSTFTVTNIPVPVLTSINPASGISGGAAFTLTVNGSGFVNGSVVQWNGSARTTTFVNSTQLTAAVSAADIANVGSATVTVFNPAPGGGTSAGSTFTINAGNPVPVLTSTSPATILQGSAAFTMTVTGSGFVNGASFLWNFAALPTTFVNSTTLSVAVPAANVASSGMALILVTNPAPGGGQSVIKTFSTVATNPLPSINSLSPVSAAAGSGATTITVNGSNFSYGQSVVYWNGAPRTTTYANNNALSIQLSAADLASPGLGSIDVRTPAPGGGNTVGLTFTIASSNPVPAISSLSPNSTTAGSAAFTLTVNGSGFVNGSVVNWNGSARTTTFVNSGQLTASIPAGDVTTVGSATVTVFSPAPGGGTSAGSTFSITNPLPTIGSLSPNSATAGAAAFTLTVNGSNFVNGAVVNWNGSARTTTFVNSGQLTASILVGDIAAAGTPSVTVFNPAPGGGTSAGSTFTVNNPAPIISTLSPNNGAAGGAAFTLTVNGSGFVNGSTVRWNGSARTTTFVNSGQLTAAISAADIAAAGSATVTVLTAAPGGGTSAGSTFTINPPNNPVPALSSLSPNTANAAGAAFTLTVNGSNFVGTSVVNWNGSPRTTTFVNSGQLTAAISAADIAAVGTPSVTVFNPAPGGGTSGGSTFTITANPVPSITSLSPLSATAGGPAFTLTINGSNFVGTSVVNWNGSARTTTFVNSTQLTASILAADIAAAGSPSVTVVNPAPGGGTSAGSTFTVTANPVPAISSLSPNTAPAASGAFTLTVNGSGFVNGSVVNWNGSARTTTFVNSTQLTAAIAAADIAAQGTATVTVFNPAPGGGTSGGSTFTVTVANNPPPSISSLSPNSATAGDAAFTLTVNGSGFVNGSVVNWNGSARTTTFVNSTQLTAAILAGDVAAVGTPSVTVFTPAPGGGTSAGSTFTINPAGNPVPVLTTTSPATILQSSAAFTMTVTGSGFVNSSVFLWNFAPLPTTFVNPTTLTVAVPAANVATSGMALIAISNPAPGGGQSVIKTFSTVTTNPLPAVNSVSPASVAVGSGSLTLSVTGSGFSLGQSAVYWNGVARPTTFISSTQLSITVSAADVAVAGSASIDVRTPAPGGGNSSGVTFTVTSSSPVPVAASLAPSSAVAGGAAFTLTVNGSGFVNSSVVRWNGANRTTTFINAGQLTAAIPASDIAALGSATVTVFTPAPGGGTSAGLSFSITNNPVPVAVSLAPSSAGAVGPAFSLTVNGSSFVNGSVVQWNGSARTTTFVNSGQLTAAILASDIAAQGTATVTVFTPAPGGGTSAGLTFTITAQNNPAPVLASISPLSATVGGPAFTITVNGSGFFPGSVVRWNGSARTTTFVNAGQLTAAITAADIAAQGSASVTVFNAAPGGGTSAALSFAINQAGNPVPVLSSTSPTSVLQGTAAFTMTVTGSGFVDGSVFLWNFAPLPTTFVNPTTLSVAVPAANVTSTGMALILISNPAPGGGQSVIKTFSTVATNPLPAVNSISPVSVAAGAPAFTLTVTGSGFSLGQSVVHWDGSPRSTTFISSTQLSISVSAADIAAVGIHSIDVRTPAPGGGNSSGVTFSVIAGPLVTPAGVQADIPTDDASADSAPREAVLAPQPPPAAHQPRRRRSAP